MGLFISSLFDALSGQKQKRILLLGLDAAGKTTILYKLNLGDTVTTIPTIGFNVEKVKYKNVEFTCWDIGEGYTLVLPYCIIILYNYRGTKENKSSLAPLLS